MKRLIAIAILLLLGTNLYAMSKEELQSYKENKLLQSDSISFVAGKKLGDGLVLIKGFMKSKERTLPFQIVTNKKIAITSTGQVYDVNTGKEIKIDLNMNLEQYVKDAAYTIGKGKEEYFLFTEAECPICKSFHKKFEKSKLDGKKVHVFLFPLSFHFLAKPTSIATLSQPIAKRHEYYKKMLTMKPEDAVKEVAKYSPILFERVMNTMNSFKSNNAKLAQKYIYAIEKAYKVKFKSREDVVTFCKKQIKQFNSDSARKSKFVKVSKLLDKQMNGLAAILGVNGTPSVFDAKGNPVDRNILLK